MREELEVLIKIQEKDVRIRRNEAQIDRLKAKKEELKSNLEKEKEEVMEVREDLEGMKKESRNLNNQVDDTDYQIRKYKDRLEEGIISFKEMETLQEKISKLQGRLEDLEDEALDLMLAVEEKETEVEEEESSLAKTHQRTHQRSSKIDREIDHKKNRIKEIENKRSKLKEKVSNHLLKRYQRLKENFDDPIVKLEGRSCGGCKLSLSATTVERVREDMEIVTCENCSRILYSEPS